MRYALALAAMAGLPLAACGDQPETAAEVHEERAEQLKEAADVSSPAGANQLENLAEEHREKAEMLKERPGVRPADPSRVHAPIPDNVAVGNQSR